MLPDKRQNLVFYPLFDRNKEDPHQQPALPIMERAGRKEDEETEENDPEKKLD